MKEMVAYCGIDCTECPAYQATQKDDDKARAKLAIEWGKQFNMTLKPQDINCDGCIATGKRLIGYCNECEIRRCGSNKKILNCGYCVEYPCDKLSNLHKNVAKAKDKLESIRTKQLKSPQG